MPSIGPDASLPDRIGAYKVLRRLATGGTSDVLLARAEGPRTGKTPEGVVVLKLLLKQFRDDPEFERMFAREAGTYTRLSHPAIVRLYDFFNDGGQLVMVLEYVDGFPLHKLRALLKVRGQQLDPRASAYLGARIFSALSAAHTAKDPQTGAIAPVVHRDVNPSNVLVPWDGEAKIADFGIAKVTGDDGDTRAGFIKGTYGYMAPEQVRGEEVTSRADVYAACLLLWELMAGRKAIVRGSQSDVEVLRAMAEPRFPALSALRPDLPKPVLDVVAAGLEPDPGKRTVTAEQVAQVLRICMSMQEGRAALVEALVGVRPPAPVEEPSMPPPPNVSSADATIPNPLAVKRALASVAGDAPLPHEGPTVPSAPPAARSTFAKGGTLVMGQSPFAQPSSAPRAPIPPRPLSTAPRPLVPPAHAPIDITITPEPSAPVPAALAATVLAPMVPARPPLPPAPPAPPPPFAQAFDPFPAAGQPSAPPAQALPVATPLPPSFGFAPGAGSSQNAPVVLPMQPRRRGRAWLWVVLGLVVLAVGAVGGIAAVLREHGPDEGPPANPAPSAPVARTGAESPSPPPSAQAAHPAAPSPSPSTEPGGPPPAPAASAAQSPVAPSAELPPPAATMGRIVVSPDHGGHRIWVDKHLVGESPGSFDVPCGKRTIQVGSAGTPQTVEVRCGAETEVQ
jgi:serine/threonine-protein kinase